MNNVKKCGVSIMIQYVQSVDRSRFFLNFNTSIFNSITRIMTGINIYLYSWLMKLSKNNNRFHALIIISEPVMI